MAGDNLKVLLRIGREAEHLVALADRAFAERAATPEDQKTRNAAFGLAVDCYQRAIKADPADPRAYLGLGQVYYALGNMHLAVYVWQAGLNQVKSEAAGVDLNLALSDVLIQQGRFADADKVLKNLDEVSSKLSPQWRLSLETKLLLPKARLAFRQAVLVAARQSPDPKRRESDCEEARELFAKEVLERVNDLATGKVGVQGEDSTAAARMRYEAWSLIGDSYAGLQRLDPKPASADEYLDKALAAFEQAALLKPGEPAPHLAAAAAWREADRPDTAITFGTVWELCGGQPCREAGRSDAAISHYEQALQVLSAMPAPPADKQIKVYDALVDLSTELKRTEDAKRYISRRKELIAKYDDLMLGGVNQAVREGNPANAVELANSGVGSRPGDPLALLVRGLAERANSDRKKAAEDYRKAFEMTKDSPEQQIFLAGQLIATKDPLDAAEAEKALRDLLPNDAPAALPLVTYLVQRGEVDAALAVAYSGVQTHRQDWWSHAWSLISLQTHPQDWWLHVALGCAWCAKKDNAQAEAEFQEAVGLAPDEMLPKRFLLDLYIATDQATLARETLDKMLAPSKPGEIGIRPAIERELFSAGILMQLDDRTQAEKVYRKAVETAGDDPEAIMELARFLVGSSDPDKEAEGERLLRRIEPRLDAAPPPSRSTCLARR